MTETARRYVRFVVTDNPDMFATPRTALLLEADVTFTDGHWSATCGDPRGPLWCATADSMDAVLVRLVAARIGLTNDDLCGRADTLQATAELRDRADALAEELRGIAPADPVFTRADDGTVTMTWPTVEGQTHALVSRDALERFVEVTNGAPVEAVRLRAALHSIVDSLGPDAFCGCGHTEGAHNGGCTVGWDVGSPDDGCPCREYDPVAAAMKTAREVLGES